MLSCAGRKIIVGYPAEATHLVEWLQFTLRAWDCGGTSVPAADFLDRLIVDPGDSVRIEDGPGVPRVRLLSLSMEDFADVDTSEDAGAKSEAFAGALREG